MHKNFQAWVLGVFEDTPLPLECKNVYFCLHKDNAFSYLSFGANEFELNKLFNFCFYPLDAQFFDIQDISQNFSLYNLRKLIENALNDNCFYTEFLDKSIFYGNYQSSDIFKIN